MHKVLRVNWTSYDMRRMQDSINPRTHPDVVLDAADGSTHPYLYARILGIFHVLAYRAGPGLASTEPELMQVLWVRWFDLDTSAPGGLKHRRLHRLQWARDDDSFGFVSPECVLRATHLIPAFAYGRTDEALPGYSIARQEDDDDDDEWRFYYVSMYMVLHRANYQRAKIHCISHSRFVDRDMFMRYVGDAVGHQRYSSHTNVVHPFLPPSDVDEDLLAGPSDSAVVNPEDAVGDPVHPAVEDEDEDDSEHGGHEDIETRDAYEDEEADYGYLYSSEEDEDEDGDDDEDGDEAGDIMDGRDEVLIPDLGPEDGEDISSTDDLVLRTTGYSHL